MVAYIFTSALHSLMMHSIVQNYKHLSFVIFRIPKCGHWASKAFWFCPQLSLLVSNALFFIFRPKLNTFRNVKHTLDLTSSKTKGLQQGSVDPRYVSLRWFIVFNQTIHFLRTDDLSSSSRWFKFFQQMIYFLQADELCSSSRSFVLFNQRVCES